MQASKVTNNQQSEEFTSHTEIVLHDVLYNIFSYLSIYDLTKAAKVCKSWYYAARIEESKRGPQIMILQALDDFVATRFSDINPINENERIDDFKLSLRIKPRAGFFFTDGKYPATADCDNVPYEICRAHKWTQPEDCFYLAIEALGVSVNENAIGGERNITAALFLPESAVVNYTIVETSSQCVEQYLLQTESLRIDIIDKLFFSTADHVCFIIFIYQWIEMPTYELYHSTFLNRIFDYLKTRFEPGTYSLWGGSVNDIFTMETASRVSYLSTSFCGMGISGSSVTSWSIVLEGNLLTSKIEDKLTDFKTCVNLKSTSMAFLIIPTEKNKIDRSKVNIFKRIFPMIPLLSIFNDKNHLVFSVDSRSKEPNPKLLHKNSYAYMILTYK